MAPPTSRYEKALNKQGYFLIAGVDEAGRGPLAGPVVAAAVILPRFIKGLDDCKLLNPEKRENLFKLIRKEALAIGIGVISHTIIDRINIYQATLLAMKKAVLNLVCPRTGQKIKPDYLLVDGKLKINCVFPQNCVIAGDRKCFTISAASIIAKVTRDQIMLRYHRKYPLYGFDRHKGYGTKSHLENLLKHKASPIHRRSFAPCAIILQN